MSSRNRILSICLLAALCRVSYTEPVTVQISDGEILGSQFVSSWTNKPLYSFLGIPYASPPIEDFRFKPPVPPAKWNVTKDCTNFGASCMQGMPSVSEDCLFLNVYSPELKPTGALAPVYVWIHGGGFVYGAGSWYGPDPMVAEGVVVVTINYRLGAFGFLTLGTSDIPGNAALFDQVLALKWVQKEISKFGGDPNRVTIGGESAGSMMIHLHYMSLVSKGLFQAAIGESGTSLVSLAPAQAPAIGLELAKLVNCSSPDITDTQKCLKTISADVIFKNQVLITVTAAPWVPTVDKDTNKDNPFLPATPAELMAQGQGSAVPFLMGTNKDEGTTGFSPPTLEQTLKNLDAFLPYYMSPEVMAKSSNATIQQKLNKLKAAYFNGTDDTVANNLGYIKMFGDFEFDYPTAKSAQSFYSRSSVFLYHFVFNGGFRTKMTEQVDQALQISSLVGHCDDIGYLFLAPIFSNQTSTDPNSREMVTFSRMVRLWTNFIKYGTPTPSPDSLLQNVSWTSVQNNSLHFLEISDNLTMVQSDYRSETVQLWDDINSLPSPSSASTLLASLLLFCLFSFLF